MASDEPSGCPVNHNSAASLKEAPIDPRNRMPNMSQDPHPDQQKKLSVERERSTIPRGTTRPSPAAPTGNLMPTGATDKSGGSECPRAAAAHSPYDAGDEGESVWVYPSEQQFYNAMKRKNWKPSEHDMKTVVSIHNVVNEVAWKKVLEWEKDYASICPTPTLVRFEGRPNDVTPKARFRNLIGYKLPFDRHDWVVDRCGQEVTYVIDFYSGNTSKRLPDSTHRTGDVQAPPVDVPAFFLDVRPKLTPQTFLDRVRHMFS
ncbi:Cytochrome c1 heme lyase [Tieghemiomyces parasiticus]|uniref:Holocytochrome c-type synthase n=1 Tax=Tieghemiomyces parasiticus TaxID=78921 RepID=A0A9W8AIV9_9FUNG|nr:Cytochrome c1 heme lyase [Tieghemiomyces parasiticus]